MKWTKYWESIYVFSKLLSSSTHFREFFVPSWLVRKHSIITVDDATLRVRNGFTMGWHRNVDTFYLLVCQTYGRVPKHLIHENTYLLIIYKRDNTNFRHIYDDHVITDNLLYTSTRGLKPFAAKHGNMRMGCSWLIR